MKREPIKHYAILIIIIVTIMIYVYYTQIRLPPIPANTTTSFTQSETTSNLLYAIYYDPLYREYPNDTLVKTVRDLLVSHGYRVDIYLGKNASLDQLGSFQNYNLIIIRAHGAYSNKTSGNYPHGEYFYTGLYYNESKTKYGEAIDSWIRNGYLALGVIPPLGTNLSSEELDKLPKYLVIGPKYVSKSMSFKPGSIVMVFGCYTMEDGTLANIVLRKGALAYVGLKGDVTPEFIDIVLPKTIQVYLTSGLNGLEEFIDKNVTDPYTGALLVGVFTKNK